MEFDLENPLTASAESQNDAVESLFENELDRSPLFSFDGKVDDIRLLIRREVFCLIYHARYCYNIDPSISYLAVNYVDRFICKTEVLEKKRWMLVILAISSLSLAAKMKNTDISASLYNLLREESMDLDIQSGVQRMEMLILTSLSWRMRSITPFSFLNFFISFFQFQDASLPQALKCCSSHIIFNSQHEMKLLEYKPSIIAASAFLLATQELMPANYSSFSVGVSACEYINKEKLVRCLKIMEEAVMDGCMQASHSLTPKSVLDQQCPSPESGSSHTISGSDNIKRRRVSDFCTDDAVQNIVHI